MVTLYYAGIITEHACQEMTRALAEIQSLRQSKDLPIIGSTQANATPTWVI